MRQAFSEMLQVGGKTNSLGRAEEVIAIVLQDKSSLDELYTSIFHEDSWVRMRAIDSFEKICRIHPEWITSYIDRFSKELSTNPQASIQWHIAQMYKELPLTAPQKNFAIQWLKKLLASHEIDWIVSANAMDTLAYFTREKEVTPKEFVSLLNVQQKHKSPAVRKRADKFLKEFNN